MMGLGDILFEMAFTFSLHIWFITGPARVHYFYLYRAGVHFKFVPGYIIFSLYRSWYIFSFVPARGSNT
jgi:hypothetical protein